MPYHKGGHKGKKKKKKMGRKKKKMKVKAPRGYHFMKKKGGKYSLMKHSGKFKKHKGASLYANFPIQKRHK